MIRTTRAIECDGRGCVEYKMLSGKKTVQEVRAVLKRRRWLHVAGYDFCPHCAELYRGAQSGMNGLGRGWPKRAKKPTVWRPIYEPGAGIPVQPSDAPPIKRGLAAKIYYSLQELRESERKSK